jgi:hypothetical protein
VLAMNLVAVMFESRMNIGNRWCVDDRSVSLGLKGFEYAYSERWLLYVILEPRTERPPLHCVERLSGGAIVNTSTGWDDVLPRQGAYITMYLLTVPLFWSHDVKRNGPSSMEMKACLTLVGQDRQIIRLVSLLSLTSASRKSSKVTFSGSASNLVLL